MKVLVLGPSGSGKTYISYALRKQGINALDADSVVGLSSWYNRPGEKIAEPKSAQEVADNHYSFLWSKKFLRKFLDQFSEVYLFGGSGNVFDMIPLFDKIFFLKIDFETQKERIKNSVNRNRMFDFNNDDLVIWGEWFEEEARKRNIPFLDASLTPGQIFSIISRR